jgi:EAL domain-containing protein (putative c-di-GMP-specific phosphodiesterase class I)/GGDEF domain-containing protein
MISTVALSLIFTLVAFFITSDQLSLQQKQQHELVKLYLESSSGESEKDIESLAKTLMNNQEFLLFKITNADNEIIFQSSTETNWLANKLSPKISMQKLSTQNITISLQTNASDYAFLLLLTCAAMLILAIIFALIVSKNSVNDYKKIIERINHQIKSQLTHALTDSENESHDDIFDLPELSAGITEIKNQISNHISDAGALEKEAYVEPLTQLENRSRFVQFFETKSENIDFGVLTITRCSELQTINQIHGYTEGDNYICKVADIMKNAASKYQSAKIFRLNSSDFATILPNTTLKDAENFAKDLTNQFNEYQQASDLDSVGYTGLVYFDNSNPLGELLALADTGISVAQTQQINSWYSQTDSSILESSSASYGNQNWRQEIENVLENKRVTLLVQHIKPTSRNTKTYNEVLARFLNENDEMLPTASFIAMAEKLDKIVEVDRMIIEKAMLEISEKNLHDQHFGINISARTIHDEQFLIWLERRLLREPNISSNLIFEITEFGLQQNIKTSKRFIDMIHRAGARVTVERFGVGLTSFKFFRDLKPDYIKMDSTYTRDIDEDKNNQYFLRLMVDLAHRLSITVLAESVESQEEIFTLEKLFIDGCQGFHIGKPEAL